jgi:hypothetical protein
MKMTGIDPEVLAVMRTSRLEGRKLILLPELDRTLYVRTDEVSKALGCK